MHADNKGKLTTKAIVVSSILSEAKDIIGKCDDATVFKRITDAVRLANQQLKGDANVSYMDLCVCDGCVTLPQDVATVLAVNSNGQPTLIRDQWFQYHINGSGNECGPPCGFTDELGQVSTFKDPHEPVLLVGVVENSQDSGASLRVFGWDENGKRIFTEGANGVLEDGFLVPTIYGFSVTNPDAPAVARIDRIEKALTNGFIQLIAVDPTTLSPVTMIGYYLPFETNPRYRRIRVGNRSWVRIKYRKKDIEVRSASDWINIENREALLLLLKAVNFRLKDQIEKASAFEIEGMRLLSNEIESLQPPGLATPQIIFNTYKCDQDTLFY